MDYRTLKGGDVSDPGPAGPVRPDPQNRRFVWRAVVFNRRLPEKILFIRRRMKTLAFLALLLSSSPK